MQVRRRRKRRQKETGITDRVSLLWSSAPVYQLTRHMLPHPACSGRSREVSALHSNALLLVPLHLGYKNILRQELGDNI